jgi:tripartite motif-containing protein 2/3/tripartite motif-containing protein 71
MTVYPDPTQLGHPVRVVTELNRPYGIAVNSRGEIVISECDGHNISVFDEKGKSAKKFGSHGDSPEQMIYPAGIAIDDADNVYVSSEHKLQKFTKASSGEFELKKCIGQKGSGENDFDDPRGVTLYKNQLYVCDRNNDRIQVLNLDLNFVDTITSSGKGICEFNKPFDVQFDNDGNMYIAEYGNKRVQVMDSNGCYLREFGQERLKGPSAICIVDDRFVYVSDFNGHCIVVYETSGQFVTSFGRRGHEEGEFDYPCCITSCADGFIHVCDFWNNRVQIF